MGFPNISKATGWLLILLIVGFFVVSFCFVYYGYFGTLPQWNNITLIALLSACCTQIAIIPAGHSATLTFLGMTTKTKWKNGIVPLPNLFHVTAGMFHFSLLWGLLIIKNDEHYSDHYDSFIHQDNRGPNFGYVTKTTPFGMGVAQLLTWFFFGWQSGSPHLWVSKFGYRVMIVTVMLTFANGGVIKLSSISMPRPEIATKDGTITVRSTLNAGVTPIMPAAKWFSMNDQHLLPEYVMIDGDSRKYYIYKVDDAKNSPTMLVEESLCAMVPPDKVIVFYTKLPPKNEINMHWVVEYTRKESSLSWRENLGILYRSFVQRRATMEVREETLRVFTDWRYLHENWEHLFDTRHPLIVVSLKKEEISKDSPGGLVCF